MKTLSINLIKPSTALAFFTVLIASCGNHSYANHVHPHGELAVEGYKLQGVQPTYSSGFFVRNISMRSHFMAKLERDTFECTGNLVVLSSNPFQFCHHHLEVIGRTPKLQGAHNHA